MREFGDLLRIVDELNTAWSGPWSWRPASDSTDDRGPATAGPPGGDVDDGGRLDATANDVDLAHDDSVDVSSVYIITHASPVHCHTDS